MKKINVMILALSMAFVACDQTEKETPVENMRENPLLSEWNTPFGVPPFDLIEDGDYLPAFESAFTEHNAEIDAIVTNTESPSFTNTIVALEESGASLSKISNVFYSVESANTNDSLKEIGKVPLLTAAEEVELAGALARKNAAQSHRQKALDFLDLTGKVVELQNRLKN